MPKVVDHEERRSQLADAALRLVARGGVSALTNRAVAAESGWSTGVVNHYFDTAADLQHAALRRAAELQGVEYDRIRAALPDPRDRLAELTRSVLPVDERRLALTRIFLAFYAEAATVEAAREELCGYLGRWRAVVLEAVGDAQAAGLVASELDPVRLTFHLVGLTDGLAIQAVVDETVLARLQAGTDIGRELVDVAIGKELE
jgi:DNA-binding transcriptional regulator YbjK